MSLNWRSRAARKVRNMLAASPGERVRTLRELLGLTQMRLANIAGVKQSWLSDVETGSREVTISELSPVAKATGTPLTFFSVRPAAIPLDSLRFRKLASASKITTRRIHAFYGESYRVADTLLAAGKYPYAPLPYTAKDELSDEDIEEYAGLARQALRLAPDKPIPHLTRALERAGIAVAPFVLNDFDTGELGSAGHHFGVSYWGGIGETALIGYFPGEQGDRDRFTMGHELGHLVLHTFRPHAADAEDEANRFAGALLLPRDRILSDVSDRLSLEGYARLKATWGTSIQAIIMRSSLLGAIGDVRKRSLFVQLSQRGWRKQEPVLVGQEKTLLLWRLLSNQFGDRPYLTASDELAIHPVVLRSIAPAPPPDLPGDQPEALHADVVRLNRRSER
jgi:Zn-dependent peptidase ImmA (M78 family)/transcriptional regulator with XRE-family HTH domain